MSITSVSCTEGIADDFRRTDLEQGEFEAVAQRAQSVWRRVYTAVTDRVCRVIHIVRSAIGAAICKTFFFPLKWGAIIDRPEVKKQLRIEETYCRNFWDPTKPLDPNCKAQAKIRELFKVPEDRTFSIPLGEGQQGEVTCRVIETKAQEGPFYNFIYVSGIYTTIDNNIGIYPYLAAYLHQAKQGMELPAARFIVVSENNLHFLPQSLDEAGKSLLETMKALRAEYGDIHQLVAHSLGAVFTSNALKHVDDPKDLPCNFVLDRGPRSLLEVSKNYFWGLGRLFYFLMEAGRWAGDPEQELVDFYQKWDETPSLVIACVEQDHYFSGGANLCCGPKIRTIPQACFLVFDPPRQFAHASAHHNLRTDFLNPRYLTEESDFMEPDESFSEAIIRHSLPRRVQDKMVAG